MAERNGTPAKPSKIDEFRQRKEADQLLAQAQRDAAQLRQDAESAAAELRQRAEKTARQHREAAEHELRRLTSMHGGVRAELAPATQAADRRAEHRLGRLAQARPG